MEFQGKKGEHFFRSTLVQTIFYGVFSSWVLWHKENPLRKDSFDWKTAAWTLHVPMIKALFEQIATPTKLAPLGLIEVLDWTAAALNRVDRTSFFENFVEAHAVQYFYEPFLEAFDPDLRKELGVWFTPPEIVQYMVARIDTVLREELGVSDGFADSRVLVLDPCCGTGAYLVEVLRKIVQTLKQERGEGALAQLTAKEAIQGRVFGFELLPAPFVVAHLQIGLLLQNLGVPLDDAKAERAGIFLTNSLTGWEIESQHPELRNWPELEAERAGAGKVKRETPILVVLGNPPYNAFAGVSPEEEKGVVEAYKGIYWEQQIDKKGNPIFEHGQPVMRRRYRLSDAASKGGWGIKKFNLDDLYVRFFRLAERRIAEKTGTGIVCYISNFSYLRDPSFVIMRERFLQEFDRLWFDCLNGDSRETGKLTPDGKPDPSVFSTEYNREGIRVGTAVGLMVRKLKRTEKPEAFFRQFWGANKRAHILESLNDHSRDYTTVEPKRENRFSFHPETIVGDYANWPKITDLCQIPPLQGMDEDRANSLIEFNETDLADRMNKYFDSNLDWTEFEALGTGLSRRSAAFEPKSVRRNAQNKDSFMVANIRRYLFRPCDVRWCYYTPVPNVWKRSRPELWKQSWPGNGFVLSRATRVTRPEGTPFIYTPNLLARDCMRGHAVAFPLLLRRTGVFTDKKNASADCFNVIIDQTEAATVQADGEQDQATANLSSDARTYLKNIGLNDPDSDSHTATLIWMHVLAIGYSPAYLIENTDGVGRDWPRIPLPNSKEALLASAALGRTIAGLLDTETAVDGVTGGKVRAAFQKIAVLLSTSDLAITAGWGHAGKARATMPGKGHIEERDYGVDEQPSRELLVQFGQSTCDVYLNDNVCWRNIPINVWDYTIGGYQVLKKWLSYREYELLGRPITVGEAREVTHMARRIAALLWMQPDLDNNYHTVKAATAQFSASQL